MKIYIKKCPECRTEFGHIKTDGGTSILSFRCDCQKQQNLKELLWTAMGFFSMLIGICWLGMGVFRG